MCAKHIVLFYVTGFQTCELKFEIFLYYVCLKKVQRYKLCVHFINKHDKTLSLDFSMLCRFALFLTLLLSIISPELSVAATVQTTASIENSRFLGGTNLSDDSIAVSLAADITFNNGGFTGADCYSSSAENNRSLRSGCEIYAGYFKPLSDTKAVSAQLTHHSYSRGLGNRWNFTDLSMSLNTSKATRFTAVFAKNWLNRPFDTLSMQADHIVTLSEFWRLNLSATLMAIESSAPISSLSFARATVSYSRARWSAETGIGYTDKDQRQVLPFDVDESELILNLSYRFY